MPKNILVLMGAGAVLAVVLVLLVFVPFFGKDNAGEERSPGTLPAIGERPVGAPPPPNDNFPQKTPPVSDNGEGSPIGILKPLPDVIPLITPPPPPIGEKGTPIGEIPKSTPPAPLTAEDVTRKTQEIMEKLQQSITAQTRGPLTEKEIFDILWRPEFIVGLRDMERMEIIDGEMIGLVSTSTPPAEPAVEPPESTAPEIEWYIPPSERSSYQTDQDVFKGLKNVLEQMHRNGWIKDNEHVIYQKILNETLPKMVAADRKNLSSGLPQTRMLPGQQQIIVGGNPLVLSANILSGLKYVMQEAGEADAFWYMGPSGLPPSLDCYKDDVPFYPVPGYFVPTFFCNAAIEFNWVRKRRSHGFGWYCTPALNDDCGIYGIECWIGNCAPPIELGCLNSPMLGCKLWPNAIWDAYWNPAPTMLCGCG